MARETMEQSTIATPIKFVAKCHNQVLTMKPKRNQVVDGMVLVIEGEHIRFDRFEYTTENQREIDFIRKHKLYGFQISDAAGM